MKRVIFPITVVLFTPPGLAQANLTYGSLQVVHEKNTTVKDLRKIYIPQRSLSDEVWEKAITVDTRNQQHIREATLVVQRNNQNNYWEALGKVEYPSLQAFG